MEISRERLTEISRTFLDVLDKERIIDVRDLEKLAGQAIPINGKDYEYLMVSWLPSSLGTRVIDASYVIQHEPNKVGGGIPLCLKINRQLGYSLVIIKTVSEVEGYAPFAEDPFENIIQERMIKATEWKEVKGAVEDLA